MEEIFRPSSPLEIFSDKQPTFKPQTREDEALIPIDELLGRYNYRNRSIYIFAKNITHFAGADLKCDVRSLEYIVRVHEYAHALLHIGLWSNNEHLVVHTYPSGQQTDWRPFLRDRSAAFRSLRSEVHEFIAQVISWMVIGVVEPLSKRNGLQELFVKLMVRQPAKYVLNAEILGKALYGDPTLLLTWARDPLRRKFPIQKAAHEAAEELLKCGSKDW